MNGAAAGPEQPALLCFGFGYSARALARRLGPGWCVIGTSRDGDGATQFAAEAPSPSMGEGRGGGDLGPRPTAAAGVTAAPPPPPNAPPSRGRAFKSGRPGDRAEGTRRFDRAHPLPAEAFADVTHILVSVPPDAAGDPVLDLHGADIAILPGLAWLGYLSTTGVYGDRGGEWVDETSDLRPSGERGRRRVAAEAGWLGLHRKRGMPVHIFRLAGIYGPGRSPFDALRAGTAKRIAPDSRRPGQVFSRIHVDDLASVLLASMAHPRPGAIYNVCDDEPAEPADVVAHAASLLGVPPPPLIPFAEAELSPMAKSFYDDNKRVSNALVKHELGVTFRYPDYRAGLAAILAARG